MQASRFVAAVAVVASVLVGCSGARHQAEQHAPPPVAVGVAHAQRSDIASVVTLDGQIQPLMDSTLSFQQSGPIATVDVNVGDRVRKGELLATIDASTLRAELAQSEAEAQQAAARARGTEVGVPITQAQTQAAVQSAKAAVDNAKLTYDQDTQLYKQGYVSLTALENARSAYVQAQSQYRSAVANSGSNAAVRLNAQADLAAERAALAQVATLRTEIGQTALYAPFDGTVTARLMDPGAMAGPNTPVLRVSQVDPAWLNLNVPDADLAYAHAGTPLTFRTPSLAGRAFAGRIAAVNAVPSQGTLSYEAQVRVPNPGNVLRGGMLVTATLVKERHVGVIVVPSSALVQTPQGQAVFVVEGGHAQRVPVAVGLQTDTLAEISSPKVRAGTAVVTRPPERLQDGSAVAAGDAPGTEAAR